MFQCYIDDNMSETRAFAFKNSDNLSEKKALLPTLF